MKKYFLIDTPVYGGLGDKTVMDKAVPPMPSKLHYALDQPPVSDLFKGPRCYIVSEKPRRELESAHFTGAALADVTVTASITFREMHGRSQLGKYFWLKISGVAGVDDIGYDKFYRIVVSEPVLALLQRFNLAECTTYDLETAPTPGALMERLMDEIKAKKSAQ